MNVPNQVFISTMCAIIISIPVGIWTKVSDFSKKKEYRTFLLKFELVLGAVISVPFWITLSMTVLDKLLMFSVIEGVIFIFWKLKLYQHSIK